MRDSTVQIIEKQTGLYALGLWELWQSRDLVWFMVMRDIRARYRQMALGPLWILLMPIIFMVVFSLVFGKMAKMPSEGLPYPLFNFTAVLPWQFFANSLNRTSSSLVSNLGTLTKIYFPRLVVPVSATLGSVVDFAASFLVMLGMMVYYDIYPGWQILLLPFYSFLALMASLGLGLWLATLSVRFRDIIIGLPFFLQVFLYLTPVVYPLSMVPERWQILYRLNPMTEVIVGWRWCLLGKGQAPDLITAAVCLIVALIFISGVMYFRRTERVIVDIL